MMIADNANTEAYRSGHNGPDSKSGSPHGLVGSNPTASAKKGKGHGIMALFLTLGCGAAVAQRSLTPLIQVQPLSSQFLVDSLLWIHFFQQMGKAPEAGAFRRVSEIPVLRLLQQ